MPDPEARLDELYRNPPDEFVAARDELAKELRAGGDREKATEVKRLRRPSVAAWLLNAAVISAPKLADRFEEATRSLETAQRALLSGEGEEAEVREASATLRKAVAALVNRAREVAHDAGREPNERAFEQVAETLHAAAADEDLRVQAMRGRIAKEERAATLGFDLAAAVPSRPRKRPPKKAGDANRRRELERKRRELEAAEERARTTNERVKELGDQLKAARDEAREAESAAKSLAREVRRLEAS